MEESTYDSCLLYSSSRRSRNAGFGIVGMQTDDNLTLCDDTFAKLEEVELKKAKLLAKPVEHLTKDHLINFNGSQISLAKDNSITLTQETQCKKINLIEHKDNIKAQYISQRVLGAYVATVCQPKASFDLSRAAQTVYPGIDEAVTLNKRLKLQKINMQRGLEFVQLDVNTLKIVTFTDGSFANNKEDMTSQIGYVICLADSNNRANIIHLSSTKCRRVTRSVLASELYAMVMSFDIAAVIKCTLQNIHTSMKSSVSPVQIPLIFCTDSFSLYECMSKLGTTTEMRLTVDVMALRQSYENNEVAKLRWIAECKNPADAMTKQKACDALKKLIDENKLDMTANAWAEKNHDLKEGVKV